MCYTKLTYFSEIRDIYSMVQTITSIETMVILSCIGIALSILMVVGTVDVNRKVATIWSGALMLCFVAAMLGLTRSYPVTCNYVKVSNGVIYEYEGKTVFSDHVSHFLNPSSAKISLEPFSGLNLK